jgi:uncharacterized phage-associated protein
MRHRKKEWQVSVFDIARYILEKTGPITAWKLQKLVYYSQAWSMVWDNRVLFENDFEAWANGPVVRELYDAHKGCLHVDVPLFEQGDIGKLDDTVRETIDTIIEDYGKFNGRELAEIVQCEYPWKGARKGIMPGEASENVIERGIIMNYYLGLLDPEPEAEVIFEKTRTEVCQCQK